MSKVWTIGGRRYREVREGSVHLNMWVGGRLHAAGFTQPTMQPGESADQFARRTLGELQASGAWLSLIAGLLLPEGVKDLDWTPEIAEDTAAHIKRQPADGEAWKAVQSATLSVLLHFFENGLLSVWTSPSASGASGGEPSPAGAVAETATAN